MPKRQSCGSILPCHSSKLVCAIRQDNFVIALWRGRALHADNTLLIVSTLPPRHRCPLDRLPASRLLLPRSGLERSDFVRWHDPDLQRCPQDGRYRG
jgi:hypothetical protein